MKKPNKIPRQEVISSTPFPASKKIYVKGKIHDLKVAMREIHLSDTVNKLTGKVQKNDPVTVYDTSGPYTDQNKEFDVKKGIEPIRTKWIADRGDVEALEELSSGYGKKRLSDH